MQVCAILDFVICTKCIWLINYLLSLDEADYLDNIYIYIDNLGYKGQQSASSQGVLEALF